MFEISDEPSKNIFETEKAKTDDEELKEGEESKTVSQTSDDHNDTQLEISKINVSLIKENMEVITVVLDNLTAIIREKKSEIIYCVNLDRLQIDNQGQLLPLFPVMLKPKCVYGGIEHDHFTM